MAYSTSKKRILENESPSKSIYKLKRHKKCSNFQLTDNDDVNGTNGELQVARGKPIAKFETSQPLASKNDHCDEADKVDKIKSFSDSSSPSDCSISDASSTRTNSSKFKSTQKRNDPDVFAKSMSKILSSKLACSKRRDPVLARSIEAQRVSREFTDALLETKARRKFRIEKKEALQKGRVRDVLGSSADFNSTQNPDSGLLRENFQQITEDERRLRKTAQRGVVKLFNAVRAAQLKGEEASREAKARGVIGQRVKEDKINEMSKRGFLDLIAKGGGGLITESTASS